MAVIQNLPTWGLLLAGLPLLVGLAAPAPPPPTANQGRVTTLAGTPRQEMSAALTDGQGPAASFYFPHSLAVDARGVVYLTDENNHAVRRITPQGLVTTLVGGHGKGSANGPLAAARLQFPHGLAVAPDGTLYVADFDNFTLRRLSADGQATTLAGAVGQAGSADGPAPAARFNGTEGLALAPDGSLYISDSGSNTIRRLTAAGAVSTVAGSPGRAGNADGPGPQARFNYPTGLAVAPDGTLYVADRENSTIRRISPAGVVSTLAGKAGEPGRADGPGRAARFRSPEGLALAPDGTLYVADAGNNTIRRLTPAGVVSTLAGAAGQPGSRDGTGAAARFEQPVGLALGPGGVLYVADSGDQTVRVIK